MKIVSALLFLLVILAPTGAGAAAPDGNSQIRAAAAGSEIVITTTARLAGAIDSLIWNGREFINDHDHGRELQSACTFDHIPLTGNGEPYNPTEAGSRDDHLGTNTTSRLLELCAAGNHLRTKTRMAFWLAPGERSKGLLARNTKLLSDFVLTKDVTIGFGRWPQALDYRVTFTMPSGEQHASAQFEALTGYLPPEFNRFWEFDPQSGALNLLPGRHRYLKNPVVLATTDGKFAMGIFAVPQKPGVMTGPNYGYFNFVEAKVVKWNCVFNISGQQKVKTGDYSFRMLVPVGTLAQVEAMLRDWQAMAW